MKNKNNILSIDYINNINKKFTYLYENKTNFFCFHRLHAKIWYND